MSEKTPLIVNFEKLLNTPRDNALLHYALGNEWLKQGDADSAIIHLREAVQRDPDFSAAWKALGKALVTAHRQEDAQSAYRDGIAAAERKGDIQAAKEMKVFLKRLEKSPPQPG